MVVRDDDGVDLAEPGQRHRHGVQPARADVLARRAPLAPHRVEEQAHAVELDEARRVTEPRDVHALGPGLVGGTDDGDRRRRRRVSALSRNRRSTSRCPDGIDDVPRWCCGRPRPGSRRAPQPLEPGAAGTAADRGVDALAGDGERPEGAGRAGGDRESVELGHHSIVPGRSPAPREARGSAPAARRRGDERVEQATVVTGLGVPLHGDAEARRGVLHRLERAVGVPGAGRSPCPRASPRARTDGGRWAPGGGGCPGFGQPGARARVASCEVYSPGFGLWPSWPTPPARAGRGCPHTATAIICMPRHTPSAGRSTRPRRGTARAPTRRGRAGVPARSGAAASYRPPRRRRRRR